MNKASLQHLPSKGLLEEEFTEFDNNLAEMFQKLFGKVYLSY